jgi:hypothetical protein
MSRFGFHQEHLSARPEVGAKTNGEMEAKPPGRPSLFTDFPTPTMSQGSSIILEGDWFCQIVPPDLHPAIAALAMQGEIGPIYCGVSVVIGWAVRSRPRRETIRAVAESIPQPHRRWCEDSQGRDRQITPADQPPQHGVRWSSRCDLFTLRMSSIAQDDTLSAMSCNCRSRAACNSLATCRSNGSFVSMVSTE